MKLSLFFLLLLVGCGSAKVSSCKTADWKIVGRIDEELGEPTTKTKMRHKEHCGAKFNEPLWHEGRVIGMKFRCSEQGAYFAAKNRQVFPSQCDEKLHKVLNVAYQDGIQVRQWRKDISSSEVELSEALEAEEAKSKQKSSWSQELGRWMFPKEPRSVGIRRYIEGKQEDIKAMESKYPPPYSFIYP